MENKNDQAPAVEGVEESQSDSSIFDDLFQIDQTTTPEDSEKVTSEDTEPKQIEQPESDDQILDEEEDSEDEEDPEDESDEEEVVDQKSIKMTVAGEEVEGLTKIVEKVNSISGANTMLAGEVKKFKSLAEAKDVELLTLKERVAQWEKYFDGKETEEPEKYKEPEKKEEEKTLDPETHDRYVSELTELKKDIHYAQVVPMMKTVLEDMGGNAGLSPKEIYGIAKNRLGIENSSTPKKIIQKDGVVRKRAKKVLGGSNRSVAPKTPVSDLPYEIQDLI